MRPAALLATCAVIGFGCATAARPSELVDAEHAYSRALGGPASTYAPLDLEAAHAALDTAEHAFASNDLPATRDLAYVAERRAELAEARAEEARDLSLSSAAHPDSSATTSTTSTTSTSPTTANEPLPTPQGGNP